MRFAKVWKGGLNPRLIAAACAMLSLMTQSSWAAERKPLWEAGAGVGLLSLPDYRGSDQRRSYALPFPYFIYRGERLSVDRQGMRARLFDSDRFHLEASFTGNFALRSAGNLARAGMPTLYPLLEAGPELVYTISPARGLGDSHLDLRLATRTAFSFGGGQVTQRGWTASPYLRLSNLDLAGSGVDFTATIGLLYGNAKYHDYLYSVGAEYSNGARPAFQASGGYGGVFSQVAAGRRFGNFWVGGYLRLDTLNGASFEASPLVRSQRYAAAGLAFSWIFAASSQTGTTRD